MSHTPEYTYNQSSIQTAVTGVNARDISIGHIEQKKYIKNNVYISPSLTPEEKEDRDKRRGLLHNVYQYSLSRLDDNKKLSSDQAINVVLEPCYRFSVRQDRTDTHKNIDNIFDECNDGNVKKLLILGHPGAGKTIALLQLGKKFYEQIKLDEENILEKPIPVVFQLSSWERGQSIEDLLIQQLVKTYGVNNSKLAEMWIKKGTVLFLLLDGLDELNFDRQIECVKKINEFSGLNNIAVCAHLEQYEKLSNYVKLENIELSVCIKPLKEEQVNTYLETHNKIYIKYMIKEDERLRELVKSPFWIDIITDVGKDLREEDDSEDRQKKLFEKYIEKSFDKTLEVEKKEKLKRHQETDPLMLDRETTQLKYDKEKTIKWLSWIASKSKSVFLIEEMQPSWLTEEQKKLYLIATLCNGMLLGLLFGTPYGLILYYFLSYFLGSSQETPVKGIVLGVAAGLIIGMLAQYFLKVHKRPIITPKREILSWQNTWKKAKDNSCKSIIEAIGIAAIVVLFCLSILPIILHESIPMGLTLIIGTYFGIITLILRIASNSSEIKDEVRTIKPNQGIIDSLNKSCQIAKITCIILAIITTFCIIILYLYPATHLQKPIIPLILGLSASLVTGGVAAFIHDSGRACQQHFALRVILYLTGCIPWNYVKFLDYVSESNKLNFLNKIGGGYQFFHTLFKDHLAFQKSNKRK